MSQELPGAAQIPQIELGGLGEVSPMKGVRNPYGSPINTVNPNDISVVSESFSVELALQEKIASMQAIIDEQVSGAFNRVTLSATSFNAINTPSS